MGGFDTPSISPTADLRSFVHETFLRVFSGKPQGDDALDRSLVRLFEPVRYSRFRQTAGAFVCALLGSTVWFLFVRRPRLKNRVEPPATRESTGTGETADSSVTLRMGELSLTFGDPSQLDQLPKEWKEFFRAAGVKRQDLEDADTARFIAQVRQRSAPTLLSP